MEETDLNALSSEQLKKHVSQLVVNKSKLQQKYKKVFKDCNAFRKENDSFLEAFAGVLPDQPINLSPERPRLSKQDILKLFEKVTASTAKKTSAVCQSLREEVAKKGEQIARLQKLAGQKLADQLLKGVSLLQTTEPVVRVTSAWQERSKIEQLIERASQFCSKCRHRTFADKATIAGVANEARCSQTQQWSVRSGDQELRVKYDYLRRLFINYLGFLSKGEVNEAEVLEEGLLRLIECSAEERREAGSRSSFWIRIRRWMSL